MNTNIHDMIQLAPLECSEKAVSALFDIVTALNDRILILDHAITQMEAHLKRLDRACITGEGGLSDRVNKLEQQVRILP